MIGAVIIALFAALTAGPAPQPVFHTQAQFDDVSARCGLALVKLMQDETEQRSLFVLREAPTLHERLCTYDFADDNNRRVVLLDAVKFDED